MKDVKSWFHNHSMRFKIVSLFWFFIMVIQIVSMLLYTFAARENLEKNVIESNMDTLSQMSRNINGILEDIMEEVSSIKVGILTSQLQSGEMEYANNNIVYQNYFNGLTASGDNYKYVNSMMVVNGQNEVHCFTTDKYLRLNRDRLFDKITEDFSVEEQYIWTEILPADYYFSNNRDEMFSIIAPIKRYGRVKSYLIVNITVAKIQEYLYENSGTESNLFLQPGGISLIPITERCRSILEGEEKLTDISRADVERTSKYILLTRELNVNNWKLSMIYEKKNMQDTTPVLSVFLLILATGLILVFGGGFVVYYFTNPIKKLTEAMKIHEGMLPMDNRFTAKYNDEVGVLVDTYNHMLDEIQNLMEGIKREQIQSRIDYLKMLQMQIQPHFLSNSLESAKLLFEMHDPKAVEMVEAIGQFYKLSVKGVEDVASVCEEVSHLDYYLKIMKMRYSSKYDYKIQIDDDIMDQEIIKFTLQPLAENAIYHGIKRKNRKGRIRITGTSSEDKVYLSVWDDGVGMNEEKLRDIQKSLEFDEASPQAEHIGIVNVQQRYRIQYGDHFGLKIDSVEGEYTEVMVVLPKRKAGDL